MRGHGHIHTNITPTCVPDGAGWCDRHRYYCNPVHLCMGQSIGLSRCWDMGEFDVGGQRLVCQQHIAQAIRTLGPSLVQRREERTE